jgi:hypothetical protein
MSHCAWPLPQQQQLAPAPVEGGLLGAAALAGDVHALVVGAQESGGIGWSLEQAQHCLHAFLAGSGHLGRAEVLHTRSATHRRRGGSTTSADSLEGAEKARATSRRSSVIDMRVVDARIYAMVHAHGWLAIHLEYDWRVPPSS